jgi:hypothetical protein
VVFLLTGHFFVSKEDKVGFLLSFIGAVFVATGSFILESYPIVVLDSIWAILSIYGFIYYHKNKELSNNLIHIGFSSFFIFFSMVIVFLVWGVSMLAWVTTFIYLLSYFLLSSGRINIHYYLFVCIIGFIISIPHLIEVQSYSVFINEFIAASISSYRLFNDKQNKIYQVKSLIY